MVTAREKVRVVRALRGLPNIADSMRRGVISYCKVRALTRIATADNEDLLLRIAEQGTVSHVEKTVRLYRRADRSQALREANEQQAERGLRCYWDEGGALVVEGRPPPEQGALVMKALQAAADALREAEHDSREAQAGGEGALGKGDDSRESSPAADQPKQPIRRGKPMRSGRCARRSSPRVRPRSPPAPPVRYDVAR